MFLDFTPIVLQFSLNEIITCMQFNSIIGLASQKCNVFKKFPLFSKCSSCPISKKKNSNACVSLLQNDIFGHDSQKK